MYSKVEKFSPQRGPFLTNAWSREVVRLVVMRWHADEIVTGAMVGILISLIGGDK